MQFKICEMCKIEERKRNGILRSNYKQTTIKQEKKWLQREKAAANGTQSVDFEKYFSHFFRLSRIFHDVLIIQCTSRRMMT